MPFILWLLFAKADRFQLILAGTEQGQHLAKRVGALLAQRQIVFATAAFVGIALNQHLELTIVGEELGMGGYQILVFALDFVAVEVEVDAALRENARRVGQHCRQPAAFDTASGDRGHASRPAACLDGSAAGLVAAVGCRTAGSKQKRESRWDEESFHGVSPAEYSESK